jgi:hypothetical protein
MRWHALAPLLVATGCNWLYGLDKTIAVDARISELPPGERTSLVWAIATTDGMPVPPAIDPVLIYKPIGSETARPMVPSIQVGDDAALATADYDLQDGSFEIPYALRESPHRIVYTLPGESVPHEVQWALTGARLTIPRTTRLDAAPVPTGSGYTITPSGLSPTTQLVAPVLYTSGVFTYSNNGLDFEQNGSSITYRYAANARPLTGPTGAPQAGKGDWVLLGEYQARSTSQSSLRSYALSRVELQPNMMTAPSPEPAWVTPTMERMLTTNSCATVPSECLPLINTAGAVQRLHTLFGAGGVDSQHMMYGVSPSTELPGFLPGVAPTFIERPLVLPFLESSKNDANLIVTDPSAELGLERVLSARASYARTVSGVTLTTSIQGITNRFETNGLQFSAPLATNIMLDTINLSDMDGVAVPPSSDVHKLKFAPEIGFDADDYVITLYEITGTSLAPVRIYHVIEPEVKISGSLLVAGHQYVLGITARTGFPGASTGDYSRAQYPFSSTTTFARTFGVQ